MVCNSNLRTIIKVNAIIEQFILYQQLYSKSVAIAMIKLFLKQFLIHRLKCVRGTTNKWTS